MAYTLSYLVIRHISLIYSLFLYNEAIYKQKVWMMDMCGCSKCRRVRNMASDL